LVCVKARQQEYNFDATAEVSRFYRASEHSRMKDGKELEEKVKDWRVLTTFWMLC
jgi:hypothetical protein